MEFEDCRLYKAIDQLPSHKVSSQVLELIDPGREVRLTDGRGRTLLHHVCLRAEKFREAKALSVVYQLSTAGCDVNVQDHHGNTCLHLAMQQENASPLVAALFRIGIDSSIKNKEGKRAEEILQNVKPEGWENTHKTFCKLHPGLYDAVNGKSIKYETIERLLKSWCKTKVYRDGQPVDLIECAVKDGRDEMYVEILTKYEKQNEFVHAVLAGNHKLIQKLGKHDGINLNSVDTSADNPNSPYPKISQLLVGNAWLQGNYNVIAAVMSLNPDTKVLCRQDGTNIVKPLLFHCISSKEGLQNPKALKVVIEGANLLQKDLKGRTVLSEAMRAGHSIQFMHYLLNLGRIDIATRDCNGKTARDYAEKLNMNDYIDAIDSYVLDVLTSRNLQAPRDWVLKGYDHILDVIEGCGKNAMDLQERLQNSRLMKPVKQFISEIPKLEVTVDYILKAHDEGDLDKVARLIQLEDGVSVCQDYCGKTILHRSVLTGNTQTVQQVLDLEPKILNIQDNMLRTALHYACCLYGEGEMVTCLLDRGASESISDVHLRKPCDLQEKRLDTAEYRQAHEQIKNFTAHVKIMRIDFEATLRTIIKTSSLIEEVELLLGKAGDELDLAKYSHVLFDCVDYGREDIAEYLIVHGCNPHIWRKPKNKKKVSIKSETGPSYQRGRSNLEYISLYQRAVEEEMHDLAALIANTVDSVESASALGVRDDPENDIMGKMVNFAAAASTV